MYCYLISCVLVSFWAVCISNIVEPRDSTTCPQRPCRFPKCQKIIYFVLTMMTIFILGLAHKAVALIGKKSDVNHCWATSYDNLQFRAKSLKKMRVLQLLSPKTFPWKTDPGKKKPTSGRVCTVQLSANRAWETRTEFVLETAQGLLLSDLGLLLLGVPITSMVSLV